MPEKWNISNQNIFLARKESRPENDICLGGCLNVKK